MPPIPIETRPADRASAVLSHLKSGGKVRGRVKVAAGASQEEVMRLAQADQGLAAHLAGKTIVKVIYVQDKLLNIVAK